MSHVVDHVFRGVDMLARAIRHIREDFYVEMSRDDAQANLDARCLLIKLNLSLLDELEAAHGFKKRAQTAGHCE